MMKRREFSQRLIGSPIAAGITVEPSPGAAAPKGAHTPRKNTLMHVGADYHSVAGGPKADMTGRANLEYNLRHGVKHLTAQMRNVSSDGAWSLDELKTMRDNCEKAGFIFEAIRMDSEYIMLRKGS